MITPSGCAMKPCRPTRRLHIDHVPSEPQTQRPRREVAEKCVPTPTTSTKRFAFFIYCILPLESVWSPLSQGSGIGSEFAHSPHKLQELPGRRLICASVENKLVIKSTSRPPAVCRPRRRLPRHLQLVLATCYRAVTWPIR